MFCSLLDRHSLFMDCNGLFLKEEKRTFSNIFRELCKQIGMQSAQFFRHVSSPCAVLVKESQSSVTIQKLRKVSIIKANSPPPPCIDYLRITFFLIQTFFAKVHGMSRKVTRNIPFKWLIGFLKLDAALVNKTSNMLRRYIAMFLQETEVQWKLDLAEKSVT